MANFHPFSRGGRLPAKQVFDHFGAGGLFGDPNPFSPLKLKITFGPRDGSDSDPCILVVGATMGQVCFTAISSNRACPTVFIALSSV